MEDSERIIAALFAAAKCARQDSDYDDYLDAFEEFIGRIARRKTARTAADASANADAWAEYGRKMRE